MRDGVDFERKIYVKQQAAWLLRQELKKVRRGEEIAIGTATDPYQPAEKRFEITRGILEELALHHGLQLGIVTKSDLVLRDVELLRRIAENNSLFVNLTVTTLDAKLARILEPRAPRPDLRLEAVRELCAAGVNAGVICAPVLPGITDSPAALDSLVRATKAGRRQIHLRQSAVPEAVLGERVPAVSRKGVSASRRRLSKAIRRTSIRQQNLQQADFGADGGLAQEARHFARIQLAQPERTSSCARRAVAAVRVSAECSELVALRFRALYAAIRKSSLSGISRASGTMRAYSHPTVMP